jgi:hypothetical protein
MQQAQLWLLFCVNSDTGADGYSPDFLTHSELYLSEPGAMVALAMRMQSAADGTKWAVRAVAVKEYINPSLNHREMARLGIANCDNPLDALQIARVALAYAESLIYEAEAEPS